jgi:hypothetical protein
MMAPKARVALTLVLDPENNTNTQLLLPFPRAGLASTLKGVLLRLRNVVMDFFKVFFILKYIKIIYFFTFKKLFLTLAY